MAETLKAVHDDDLPSLLESLGLLGKFQAGQLKCAFCKDVLTFDNLHSLFPDSGDVKLACSKPSCITELMTKMERKHYD